MSTFLADISLFFILSVAIFVLKTRAARSRNPSIYSIYVIYIITDISKICGTGKKNIYDIYRTMSTMYVL